MKEKKKNVVKTSIYVDKLVITDFRARVVEVYGCSYGHMTDEINKALRERTTKLREKVPDYRIRSKIFGEDETESVDHSQK